MPDNRVSATPGEADRQVVLAAIETIRQKMPFLVTLTPEQRRSLPKMGDQSRGFVGKSPGASSYGRRRAALFNWNSTLGVRDAAPEYATPHSDRALSAQLFGHPSLQRE